MPNPAMARRTRTDPLTLITLQTLPCGCVAGLYRTRPSIVDVELLEAKGPHCRFYGHRADQVIGLGLPDMLDNQGTEPSV